MDGWMGKNLRITIKRINFAKVCSYARAKFTIHTIVC